VPWIPELFSASVRERLERKWELERLDLVPYYDGLMSGEHAALTRSFTGEPVLHDPRRGRVIGVQAFEAYVRELGSWLSEHNMSFDPVDHVFMEPRGFEEVVLHLDAEGAGAWKFLSPSSPTVAPTGDSSSSGSTTASGP
jgi:hypothetical protein